MELNILGRSLIVMGMIIGVIGVALLLAPRLPILGRLPGDLVYGDGHFRVFIPVATSLLLSLILTLLLNLLFK